MAHSQKLPAGSASPTPEAIEAELVAYIHGEETAFAPDVIEGMIRSNRRVREAHAELLRVAAMLGHLPTSEPSRHFLRQLKTELPRLRAEGQSSRRLEELVLRMQWTLDDRVAFAIEYARHRFQRRPVASLLTAAAVILLLLGAAFLHANWLQPKPTTPLPMADDPPAETDRGEPVLPERNPFTRPPLPGPGEFELTPYQPEDRFIPLEAVDLTPSDTPRGDDGGSRPERSEPESPPVTISHPIRPGAGVLTRAEARVLKWYTRREQPDDIRGVSRGEREMIDQGLAWLAANQNGDGSWGETPLGTDHTTTGIPLPPAHRVSTTARALLAFLADSYATRQPVRPALQPRPSPGMSTGRFRRQLREYRQAVQNGFAFVLDRMDRDSGQVVADGPGSMIAQAEIVSAMAEDVIIGDNWRLRRPLTRAADWLRSQRNSDGGWGDTPGGPSTLTATVSVVQALLVYTRTPGADIDPTTPLFRIAATFILSCTSPAGMADETPAWDASGPSIPRSTAAAIAGGHLLWNCSQAEPHPGFWNAALTFINQDRYRPQWQDGAATGATTVDYDYWMWGTQALSGWSRSADAPILRRVRKWREDLVELLEARREEGPDGRTAHWPAIGFADSSSPARATATATLALQNRYRYAWLVQ